ncbi:MAG TPA: class I SAM-dependent methyltransferase [Labilithrix sp.]|nr:class I SAM-dependent methyltransferase [Labilithrix sp.]
MTNAVSPQLWFHRLATHYVVAQMLYHLNQVGVLGALANASSPLGAGALSSTLGLDPDVLTTVLEYLAGVDELLAVDEEGRFHLTDFGRQALRRFERPTGEGSAYNLFDVRVGAYGPIWQNLDALLQGREDAPKREGGRAAEAAYKLAVHFEDELGRVLDETEAGALLELGCSTGLLERLGGPRPKVRLYGLDVSEASLRQARAHAEADGVRLVEWVRADVFSPDEWLTRLPTETPGVLFSIHLHEFLAGGEARWIEAMRRMSRALVGWRMVLFEQPRLTPIQRSEVPEDLWLYNHSNILIHHIAGKGKVLTKGQLEALIEAGNGELESIRDIGYLGYQAFVVKFAERKA